MRAFLEGYQSDQKSVDLNPKSEKKFGKLVLRPLAPNPSGFSAATDEQADKGARKNYAKGLDAAAQGDWSSAIAALQKAVAAYSDYSSAWLALGTLQLNRGAKASAEKSLLEAVRADPKFALPLIPLADLESMHGDWRATLEHSQKAIDLNSAAFPDAYALNAMANVSLQNVDAAEKSAREGLRLDTQHQYPELEYSLGAVLFSKNDMAGAKEHLQAYINELPNGPNATVARGELAQIKESKEMSAKEEVATPGRPCHRLVQDQR